jgi:hypothetical protein
LRAAMINERLLYGVELIFVSHTFNRCDVTPINLSDGDQTTVDDAAIDDHGARSAFAFTTTFFGPSQLKVLT